MNDPLPARSCIVCREVFQPSRKDQIYCSIDYKYTCEQKLHHAEVVDIDHLFHKALERQAYKCLGCGAEPGDEQEVNSARGQSLGLTRRVALRPLILAPHKVGVDTQLAEKDVAASCRRCRAAAYLEIASQSL